METSVRYRSKSKLGQVGVFGATFQVEVPLEEQTPLDALDWQFSSHNRLYLQAAHEQPLRQRYYENSSDGQDFRLADSAAVPRLRKLLEKYRMQY